MTRQAEPLAPHRRPASRQPLLSAPARAARWPYNLFAMVHGATRDGGRGEVTLIEVLLGHRLQQHEILYSTRILKKTGLRLAAGRLNHVPPPTTCINARARRHDRLRAAMGRTVKPVVIWNLTRRCNSAAGTATRRRPTSTSRGNSTHDEAMGVLDDLAGFGIPALILSGGEPLSRFDFFELAELRARWAFVTCRFPPTERADGRPAQRVAEIGFDYVGISLDGIGSHQRLGFAVLTAPLPRRWPVVRACKALGVKVGLRFTITQDNAAELAASARALRR